MKKMMSGIVFALAALLLCSCGSLLAPSDLGVYDETVPKDQLATLLIPAYYTVTRFDGKPVEWGAGVQVIPTGGEIRIPSGLHEFEYRYDKPVTGGCSNGPPQQTCRMSGKFQVCSWTSQRTCTPVIPARAFDGKASVTIEAGKDYMVYEQSINERMSRQNRNVR